MYRSEKETGQTSVIQAPWYGISLQEVAGPVSPSKQWNKFTLYICSVRDITIQKIHTNISDSKRENSLLKGYFK